jgi:hypothetical protein
MPDIRVTDEDVAKLPWRQRKGIDKVRACIAEDGHTAEAPRWTYNARVGGNGVIAICATDDGEIETVWFVGPTGKITWEGV